MSDGTITQAASRSSFKAWFCLAATIAMAAIVAISFNRLYDGWKSKSGLYRDMCGWDFRKIRTGAELLREGRDPYEGARKLREVLDSGDWPAKFDWSAWYAYPPLVGIAAMPLTEVPVETAERVWLWLNIAMLTASVFLVAAAAAPGRPWVPPVLLGMALGLWTVRNNFFLGNTEVLLMFLLSLSAWLASRRRDGWAGAALGAGAAVKVFPVFLLAAPAVWRRPRLLAGTLAAGALLSLVGVAVAGWDSIPGFLVSGSNKNHSALAAFAANESLTGFLARQFTVNRVNWVFQPESPRPELVAPLAWAGTAVFVLAYLAVEWRRRRATTTGFALAVSTVLLVLPMLEAYYVAELFLGFAVVFERLARLLEARRVVRAILLAAAFGAALWLLGLRPGNWFKESEVLMNDPFDSIWLNNLWLTRVGVGFVAFWALLLALRATECDTAQADSANEA